jgi:DNA mismatch repair protein MutS
MSTEPAPVSLLWPHGPPRRTGSGPQLPPDAAADLQLDEVVSALAAGEGRPARRHHREQLVRQTLTDLCTDPAVITYRQAVVDDLLASPDLRGRLAQILPDLDSLADRGPAGRFQAADDAAVQRVARQLGDLELFVDVAMRRCGLPR